MNDSGIHPKGWTLLILLDPVEEKAGLLHKTPERIEADRLSQQNATVIEIGPECWVREKSPRCKEGDHIRFRLYAGEIVTGNDGKKYRVIPDDVVYCVLDLPKNEVSLHTQDVTT